MISIDHIKGEHPTKECIYHYTSQKGLLGIFRNRELWATNIDYLSDRSEFKYTIEKTKELLETRKDRVSNLTIPVADRTNLRKFIQEIESQLNIKKYLNIYVCSFSSGENELSLWRGYCSGGIGYSIGFDWKRLSDIARDQGFRLRKCRYEEGEHQDLIEKVIDEAFDHFSRTNPSLKVKSTVIEDDPVQNFGFRILSIAPLLKKSSFEHEAEWRLISTAKLITTHVKEHEDFREGAECLIPYFKIKLQRNSRNRLPIREVIIGPGCHKELAKNSVEALVSKTPSSRRFRIRESGIPYEAV